MLSAKSDKIFIEGRDRAEIFSYRPDNIENFPLGQLYLIGEAKLNQIGPHNLFLLNSIASLLKKAYYVQPSQGPEKRLEAALGKVNREAKNLLRTDWDKIKKLLHLCTLVISPTHLYFSKKGGIGVFIFRGGTWLNVGESSAPQGQNVKKLFSHIIQGKLQKNDLVFAVSPTLVPYMHQESFRRRLTTRRLDEAARLIRSILHSVSPRASGILLRLTIERQPLHPPRIRTIPLKETARTLKPRPLLPKGQQQLPGIAEVKTSQKTAVKIPVIKLRRSWKNLFQVIQKNTLEIFSRLQKIPFALKNINRFKPRLPLKTSLKLALTALVLIGLVFLVILLLNSQKTSQEFPRAPLEILASYSNVETIQAPTQILELKKLGLDFAPFAALRLETQPFSTLVVTGPTTLYRLRLESQQGRFIFLPDEVTPAKAAAQDLGQKQLVLLSSRPEPPWIFDPSNDSFKKLELNLSAKEPAVMNLERAAVFQNNLYILARPAQIYRKLNLESSNPALVWMSQDAASQFEELFDLALDGSIWTLGTLKKDSSLVLSQLTKGRVVKHLALSDLDLGVNIAPSPALRLSTTFEGSKILILDPKLGRIIIINKQTGQLEKQLLSPALKDAFSIELDPSGQTALILNQKAVVEMPLNLD
jgi:hypothetical protein